MLIVATDPSNKEDKLPSKSKKYFNNIVPVTELHSINHGIYSPINVIINTAL